MTPFHFGSSNDALFGIHQGAQAMPARDVGVVLCNPFGHEAIRAHRAYRQLAQLLSRARFHVLRFDYFATGDSAGEGEDATVERWLADIALAIDELKDMAGVGKIALVGLRLGGALAALLAPERRDVDHLVLWDPVVAGRDYLDELCQSQLEFLRAEDIVAQARHREIAALERDGAAGLDQAIGFPLPERLKREIGAVDVAAGAALATRRIAVVVSDEDRQQSRLRERLERGRGTVTFDRVPGGGAWNSDAAMNSSLVPIEALQAIVARLSA
jgi:pimeloyl-ACP methyl ester carboxylesterase